MLFSFWRYQVILVLLFIFWSQFLTDEALANQLVLNFAVFYPVGFLGGYRKENKISLFGAVLIFNCLTYLLVLLTGGRIEDWLIVPIDFISLAIFTAIGYFIGKFMSKTE
jgi:hypothetical protein